MSEHYWDCHPCAVCDEEVAALLARIDSLKDGLAHAATVIGRDGSADDYNYVLARLDEDGLDP